MHLMEAPTTALSQPGETARRFRVVGSRSMHYSLVNMSMSLPFVDRSSSALPVQFVAQPKWRSWLKEQSAARRGWLESLGLAGKAGDFVLLPGRPGQVAGGV